MSISLYDIVIPTYQQILGAAVSMLDKGAAWAADNNVDPEELVESTLREDMLPLRFQVISCWHHSLGAIRGVEAGEFSPPPSMPDIDYAGLQGLVREAIEGLEKYNAEQVNAMAGKDMMFRMPGMELPFVAEDFLLSFSLPNFYFHTSIAYGVLRMKGVPLGKMDFLGAVRIAQ